MESIKEFAMGDTEALEDSYRGYASDPIAENNPANEFPGRKIADPAIQALEDIADIIRRQMEIAN